VKYRTIVVDPPWRYESWPGAMSRANPVPHGPWSGTVDPEIAKRRKLLDYSSLSVAEIEALPVASLADSGCHLYLWTTNRYLPQAFDVVTAWGFRYAQLLTWAKTPMGLGPGGTFAQNAEYCLFARRGSLRHLQRSASVWFNWPRMGPGSHSRKPEHFLDLVEQVSPGPYVELFARRHRLGWDVWGNESANTANLGSAS
jgi:N6-adenosine-specific RNA methylase IME4